MSNPTQTEHDRLAGVEAELTRAIAETESRRDALYTELVGVRHSVATLARLLAADVEHAAKD